MYSLNGRANEAIIAGMGLRPSKKVLGFILRGLLRLPRCKITRDVGDTFGQTRRGASVNLGQQSKRPRVCLVGALIQSGETAHTQTLQDLD